MIILRIAGTRGTITRTARTAGTIMATTGMITATTTTT